MPELPEVDTIVSQLKELSLVGDSFQQVALSFPKVLTGIDLTDFIQQIKNQKIQSIFRRGKWIILALSRAKICFHLRMTGKIHITPLDEPTHKHERARLTLKSKRCLIFEDQRKFGRILYTTSDNPFPSLGIEPLSSDLTAKALQELFKGSKRPIKTFLLDQTKIAGLGNIYVDEALFDAKIHPLRAALTLSETEIKHLAKAIKQVLSLAITNQGTTLGSHRSNYAYAKGKKGSHQSQLKVFRKEGNPCPRCHETLIKIRAAGRGTHLCPSCQTLG